MGDWMTRVVGWVAQGKDLDVEAARFQGTNFLCNEGFRQSRIALEDECYGSAHGTFCFIRVRLGICNRELFIKRTVYRAGPVLYPMSPN